MAKQRIKKDYGSNHFVPYIYNRVKNIYPNIDKVMITKVLTMYYELSIEDLVEGNDILLPNKLGSLMLRKRKCTVKIDPETNEIINTFPINIAESVKLWNSKPELRGKKFVRYTNEHSKNYTFTLSYGLSKAMFTNKQIYSFQYSKGVKKKLHEAIMDNRTDAYLKYNHNE